MQCFDTRAYASPLAPDFAILFSSSAGLIHREDSFAKRGEGLKEKRREGTVAEKDAATWQVAGSLRLATARCLSRRSKFGLR